MLQSFHSCTQTESFCSTSVSKASLFQRHTGGANTQEPGSIPGCDSYWLVRAPAWKVVGSKGACYTLMVKVAGDNEVEAHACLYFPITTNSTISDRTILQGNCAFQNCEEKIKKRPI